MRKILCSVLSLLTAVAAFALFLSNVLGSMTLKDVLVVVKYNSPSKPEQVKKHYEFMSQAFPHVKIYGTWTETDMKTLLEDNLPVYLAPKDDEWWVFTLGGRRGQLNKPGSVVYRSILAEMQNLSTSKYAGFLFMHDDLAMDLKKLQMLNLSAPWVAYNDRGTPFQNTIDENQWKTLSSDWSWYNQEMGIVALDKIYAAHPSIEKTNRKVHWPSSQHGQWEGDFFYIPNNHIARSFRHVGGIFEVNRLFLEIAIPLFMECFVKLSEAVHLRFCSRTGNLLEESLPLIQKVCNGSDVVHPIKLSHPAMWEIYEAV